MLRDQDIYNISEWIAHNRDDILFAIGKTSSNEELRDKVISTTSEFYPQYTLEQIEEAFEDNRVLLIFNFYFLSKRGNNEYSN